MSSETIARLLIKCSDPGIVASVSNFLYNHDTNITCQDQHSPDPEGGIFFYATGVPNTQRGYFPISIIEKIFSETVAKQYDMHWKISYASDQKKRGILVSFMHSVYPCLC